MSKSKKKPEAAKAEPEILRRARKYRAAHPYTPPTDTPAHREAEIQSFARELALAASPLGQAAGRLFALAAELRDACQDFEREYEDTDTLRAKALEALTAAGLEQGREFEQFNANHFDGLIGEVRGWFFVLNLMRDLFEQYSLPGDLDDE